ncbi:hypothetical protein PRIPAC_77118 [Pristionchus pacificus]|uniref:Uncharacterized protein n=1 Tax=Pristionchus pacificus TaxID=54126 RepID=A0A2A6C2T7_PRIPA|nr:hypothetical protein PRIPAC_77118 [Pristionchus pacificus]|eukprot:PDM72418.1 hypothetical protein PRIPAC_38852 [Pristionchus pacificus]
MGKALVYAIFQLIAYLAKVANMTIVPTVIESEPDKLTWGTKQKERSFERFHSIEEAAAMVAAGKLTLIDYASSITRKKYLALDELPVTVLKKNCAEQKRVLASQQPLDFSSTAGIFLLVLTGLIAAGHFFIVELLAKRRKSDLVDSLLSTKEQDRKRFSQDEN